MMSALPTRNNALNQGPSLEPERTRSPPLSATARKTAVVICTGSLFTAAHVSPRR